MLPRLHAALLSISILSLAGCGLQTPSGSSPSSGPVAVGLSGKVIGGQQPIAGATIQLYEVGTSADASAATPVPAAATTSASDGTFTLPAYTCPAPTTTLSYLLATGGNPGLMSGTNNTSIALFAVLGQCGANQPTDFISINEITTVAAVAALPSYMTSATRIGSSSSDVSALTSAFALAHEYANSNTGSSPGTGVPSGYTVPTQQIDTLADIVSACVNTGGGTAGDGSACGNLFSYATPSSGSAPTDTTVALLDIFKNPTSNITSLLGLATPSTPFQPALTTPPPNWSVALMTANPAIVATPTPVSFAATDFAFTSSAQTVTVKNTGSSTVTLNSIALTGANPTQFAFTASTCSSSLAMNATCTLTLDFAPTGSAAPQSPVVQYADVAIANSNSSTPIYVPVSGTENPDQITVNFSSGSTVTRLAGSLSNFAGANMDPLGIATSYLDTNMQALSKSLNLGWTRFPAGTADDYYSWQAGSGSGYTWGAGSTPYPWASQMSVYNNYSTVTSDEQIVGGKGGVLLSDYATFVGTQTANIAPMQTIGVINIFTDNAQSAGQLAAQAVADGLNIGVWELGNETSYFQSPSSGNGFTQHLDNATDYLNWVSNYANAIKTAVPGAKVAVWVPNSLNDQWTQDTITYGQTNKFWDEIYTHFYPGTSGNVYPSGTTDSTTAEVEYYNGFLANNTNTLVDSFAQSYPNGFGSSMTMEISEYNIGNPLWGSLYNGLFVAEAQMRFSADTHVTNAGMHVHVGTATSNEVAILPTNDNISKLKTACNWNGTTCTGNNYPVNTATAYTNYGYYLSATGWAMQIVDGVINNSAGIWATIVSGSPTVVDIVNQAFSTTPSIYAQSYASSGKTRNVLLTNKSSVPLSVTITENNSQLSYNFTTTSIGGSDPTATNTSSSSSTKTTVAATTVTTTTPGPVTVTVPSYGVMSVSWTTQ